MSAIFVSYDRESRALAEALAEDVQALGHTVWLDRELTGGQPWWDRILATIRGCDVFVCVLTPRSLDSIACQREHGYAATLGKPILPVLLAEGISTNLLPPPLAQLQFVDYRTRDRGAALHLARAIAAIPPPPPLPDPLPKAPEVPCSYLGGVAQRLATAPALSYEEQSTLLFDLKGSLRDPESAADARSLLRQLRKRRDLLAAIAEEIDELLRPAEPVPRHGAQDEHAAPAAVVAAQLATPEPPPRPGRCVPTPRQRLYGALAGAVLGTIVGFVGMLTSPRDPGALAFVTGAGGAAAGALGGNRWLVMVAALVGAAVGWFVITSSGGHRQQAIAMGVVLGAPPGAILGAIAAIIYLKLRRNK